MDESLADVLGVSRDTLAELRDWVGRTGNEWDQTTAQLRGRKLWASRVTRAQVDHAQRLLLSLRPRGEVTQVTLRLSVADDGPAVRVALVSSTSPEVHVLGDQPHDDELQELIDDVFGGPLQMRAALRSAYGQHLVAKALDLAARHAQDGELSVRLIRWQLIDGLAWRDRAQGPGTLAALAEGWDGTPGELIDACGVLFVGD